MKVQTVPIVTISIEITPAEAQTFLNDPTILRNELRAALKALPSPDGAIKSARPKRARRVSVAHRKSKKGERRPFAPAQEAKPKRAWGAGLGYTCEQCGVSYINAKRYQNHLRDKHGIMPELVPSANGASLE